MGVAPAVLIVDPFSPTTLYRADNTPTSGKLSRSTDGGMSWIEIDAGLNLSSSPISTIAADPNTPGTLYVSGLNSAVRIPSGFLWKTVDAGSSWVMLSDSLGPLPAISVDPTTSSVVYAAGYATVYTGAPGGVYKSVNGGATFSQSSSGLPSRAAIALCIDPHHPNRLYVTLDSHGVFASSDGGATWQAMNAGLPSVNGGVIYVGSGLAIDPSGSYLHVGTNLAVFDYEFLSTNCSADTHTLCLNLGRFAVTADFQSTPEGPSAPATAVPLTADTGYFWFFDPANVEVVTKVLNGCSTNGHYWFFGSGLTNVGVQINVTDTVTGAMKPYANDVGTAFQPIQDTSAFPCP
jgi:hypothetical protein